MRLLVSALQVATMNGTRYVSGIFQASAGPPQPGREHVTLIDDEQNRADDDRDPQRAAEHRRVRESAGPAHAAEAVSAVHSKHRRGTSEVAAAVLARNDLLVLGRLPSGHGHRGR
jgi:hypothetical protein